MYAEKGTAKQATTMTVRANIKPEILIWARKSAGYSVAVISRRMQVKEGRYELWESGDLQPTIKQLRKLANYYKRPLSVFYLQEVPTSKFQAMHDYRRLPGQEHRVISPELLLEIRQAHQRRAQAIELLDEVGEKPPKFPMKTDIAADPESLGREIRQRLNLTMRKQSHWKASGRLEPFKQWRAKIEDLGVLVFQIANLSDDPVSGFAISHDVLPVIAINRKDVPNRRTFSLLHEFTHILLRASGISDFEEDANRHPEDQAVEEFCNKVAAASLMPARQFLGHQIVFSRENVANDWRNEEIKSLASYFGVSKEAIVRRLLTLGKTTREFYQQKREQYDEEYRQFQKYQKQEYKDKGFKTNPPVDAISILGRPFSRLVLETYHSNQITLSDASSFLGVRVRHIPKIEKFLAGR